MILNPSNAYNQIYYNNQTRQDNLQNIMLPFQNNASSATNRDKNQFPNNTTLKRRLRWTPELHSKFVKAVNALGGSSKATPKEILKLMKIEGLTIFHIKRYFHYLTNFSIHYNFLVIYRSTD